MQQGRRVTNGRLYCAGEKRLIALTRNADAVTDAKKCCHSRQSMQTTAAETRHT